jgi:hypothetical protein
MSKIIVPRPDIIVPNPYDLEIHVLFNTRNGNTELRMKSQTLKQINMLQVAGVLSEHASSLLRQLVSGTVKAIPVNETSQADGK